MSQVKMFHINCPHCGKFFYGEMLLIEGGLPLHCPGCDRYLSPQEYAGLLGGGSDAVLTRIKKPLNESTIPEIIYRPKPEE
jgi:hypothetical protein